MLWRVRLCSSETLLINPFPQKLHLLTPPGNKPFENTVGKGEISPFPTVFSTRLDTFLPFSSNLKLSSANSFSLEESKWVNREQSSSNRRWSVTR